MQLGDIIAMLDDDTVATEYLLGCGDVTLLLDVANVASRFNETPGEYASGAVRRFASRAGTRTGSHWWAFSRAAMIRAGPA